MPILVQRSRRPRRWAGVATFAALLLALWWTEHDAGPVHAPLPDAVADAAQHPPMPVMLSGLGPSFSAEPLDAHSAQFTAFAPSSSTSSLGASPTR